MVTGLVTGRDPVLSHVLGRVAERAVEDIVIDGTSVEAFAAVNVGDNDSGRAKQCRVDFVEVAAKGCENIGKGFSVIL